LSEWKLFQEIIVIRKCFGSMSRCFEPASPHEMERTSAILGVELFYIISHLDHVGGACWGFCVHTIINPFLFRLPIPFGWIIKQSSIKWIREPIFKSTFNYSFTILSYCNTYSFRFLVILINLSIIITQLALYPYVILKLKLDFWSVY